MVEKYNKPIYDWDLLVNSIITNFDERSKNVLIQAGHFSILSDKQGNLVPAIIDEIPDQNLKMFVLDSNYMSEFPLITFRNGVFLASLLRSKGKNVKFAYIVNDWQWINKGIYTSKTDRCNFYIKKSLPKVYIDLLDKSNFSNSDIIRTNHFVNNGIYFSEYKLRKFGRKKISNCSPYSCANEYLPFLNVSLTNFDTLISFIPMSCKIPVIYSAINFIQNQKRVVSLFHIFYDPLTKAIELSHLIKDKLSHVSVDK